MESEKEVEVEAVEDISSGENLESESKTKEEVSRVHAVTMDARTFLENYQVTDIEKDPLPIKVLRNAITKEEIPGQAVHWGFDYLDQRLCPLPMITHILQKLYNDVRQSDFSQCLEASDDSVDSGNDAGARYEPLKLMRAVVKILDEIAMKEKEDLQDSVDGIVESPDMLPHVHSISYGNIKNTRRFMEDRMTILPRMDRIFKIPIAMSYFAVFDGHNGSEAAAYAAAQLHRYLIQSMNQNEDVIVSITDAFERVDDAFVQKCKNGKVKSGSTAVLSLLMEQKLFVAWLGDSQVVLVKRGEVKNLVVPHKPERADEIDRIRRMGGEVFQMNGTYRVNGNLAVSRAIGDADDKSFIISTPDIKMLELDGEEEFLILACDGLWDEISPEAAAAIVRHQVVQDTSNVSAVSQKLIQQAKSSGSTDNISVIVVFLEPLESIKNRYESLMGTEIDLSAFKKPSDNIEQISVEPNLVGNLGLVMEMNGHGKEPEQIVDYLSFGSSRESGALLVGDEGTHSSGSGDEEMKKDNDVEVDLSDAESDDEWQFEKPSNPDVPVSNLHDNGIGDNPFNINANDLPIETTGIAMSFNPFANDSNQEIFTGNLIGINVDSQQQNPTENTSTVDAMFSGFGGENLAQAHPIPSELVPKVAGAADNPFSMEESEPSGVPLTTESGGNLLENELYQHEEIGVASKTIAEGDDVPPPLHDAEEKNPSTNEELSPFGENLMENPSTTDGLLPEPNAAENPFNLDNLEQAVDMVPPVADPLFNPAPATATPEHHETEDAAESVKPSNMDSQSEDIGEAQPSVDSVLILQNSSEKTSEDGFPAEDFLPKSSGIFSQESVKEPSVDTLFPTFGSDIIPQTSSTSSEGLIPELIGVAHNPFQMESREPSSETISTLSFGGLVPEVRQEISETHFTSSDESRLPEPVSKQSMDTIYSPFTGENFLESQSTTGGLIPELVDRVESLNPFQAVDHVLPPPEQIVVPEAPAANGDLSTPSPVEPKAAMERPQTVGLSHPQSGVEVPAKSVSAAETKSIPPSKSAKTKTLTKSPTKDESLSSKSRTGTLTSPSAKKPPAKSTTTSDGTKAAGVTGAKTNVSTKPIGPKSTTSAQKATAGSANPAAPSTRPKPTTSRPLGSAAPRPGPPVSKSTKDAENKLNAKPSARPRPTPTTSTTTAKPSKPLASPRKVPGDGPTATKSGTGSISARAPSSKSTTTGPTSSSRTVAAPAAPRPRPPVSTRIPPKAPAANGDGKTTTDAKRVGPTPRPATAATGTTRPPVANRTAMSSRPLPTSARTAAPSKSTGNTSNTGVTKTTSRPPLKPSERAASGSTAPRPTSRVPPSTKTAGIPVAGPKKLDTNLRSRKPIAPTSKTTATAKKTEAKAVAESKTEKSELIQQNGGMEATPGDRENNKELNVLNGINGGEDVNNPETEKQDSTVKENGVHADAEPEKEIEVAPVVDDLLG